MHEADQFVGLTAGADDYVPKPFSMKVLTTRVFNRGPFGFLAGYQSRVLNPFGVGYCLVMQPHKDKKPEKVLQTLEDVMDKLETLTPEQVAQVLKRTMVPKQSDANGPDASGSPSSPSPQPPKQ